MTCSNKIRWYDWLVYKLFYWRWNPILKRTPWMRKIFVNYLLAWDFLQGVETPMENFVVIVNPGVDVENQVG
jgi:hypothetical protein